MAAIATTAIPPEAVSRPRSAESNAAARAVAEQPGAITCFAGCDSARRRNRARVSAAPVRVAELDRTAQSARTAMADTGRQADPPPLNAIECIAGCGGKWRSPVMTDSQEGRSTGQSHDGPGRIVIRRGAARAKTYSAN
jgi:hypothetical protein